MTNIYLHKDNRGANASLFLMQRKDDTLEYKPCGKCKKTFPATTKYFHKDKNGTFGLHSYCKECRNEARKKYYKKLKKEGRADADYKKNKLRYIIRAINRRGAGEVTEKEVREKINDFKEDDNVIRCAYCDRKMKKESSMIHIEHFIPIAKGGENSIDNILPVCRYCNRSKADEDFKEWYRNQLFYSKEKEILSYMKVD